jgi:tRNA(Ile)-lysidine synthetase-like protein
VPSPLLSKFGGASALHPLPLKTLMENTGAPLAVACSGGPDSVAAAIIVRELLPSSPLTLLHFNHALRGDASDGDEAFVEQLATQLGAGFRSARWQTPSAHNEVAARDARFSFLHQWEYPHIIFGHHADDAVETLLMRLARGSNLQGLTAPHPISKVRNHLHLRPLLRIRKAQITAALDSLGITYRTDSSNEGGDYLRNRIRNELLPLWQQIETRDVSAGILRSLEQLNDIITPPLPRREPLPRRRGAPPLPDLRYERICCSLPLGTTLYLPWGARLTAQLTRTCAAEILALSDPLQRVWIHAKWAQKGLEVYSRGSGTRYRPIGGGSRTAKLILQESYGDYSAELRAVWPVIHSRETALLELWLPGARITAQAACELPADPNAPFEAIELRFFPPLPTLPTDAQESD